jgi:membrane-bound lytic murein transglycosylase D
MNKLRWTLITCLWLGGGVFSGWAQTANPPAQYGNALFPMPQEIAANVEFWRKVYADYPTNAVLIHDTEDLSIIYEVIELKGLADSAVSSSLAYRNEWRKLESIKDEYRSILNRLATRQLDLARLSPREKRVVEIFGANADPHRLHRAASSIRAQQGLKDRFHLGLQRSGLYRNFIEGVFSQNGLPVELIMLPHVESSFNYQAYSKVGAAGIWQFMRSTGRLFMTINYDVDERLDPIRATEAAAKLLKINYRELDAWPLAITAYNHGLNGMKRAKSLYGTDFGKIYREYNSRSFGFASRNFYAEFLAALHVATNYENYFGDVHFHQPVEFVEITTDHYLTVNSILETYKMDRSEFRQLNPALRPPVLNSQRRIPKGYTLRLPKLPDTEGSALLARIDPRLKYEAQVHSDWYRVKRGDNLNAIAQQHEVSVKTLAEYNNLNKDTRINSGQILQIPPKATDMLASAAPPAMTGVPEASTPAAISAATPALAVPNPTFAVATDATSSDAELEPLDRIEREAIVTLDIEPAPQPALVTNGANVVGGAGDVRLPSTPVPEAKPRRHEPLSEWIHVEADETLGHYATWLEIPTQRLRELNGLRYNQEIHIGQRIRLNYERVSAEEFQHRRYEYQRSVEEDFFSTYAVDTLRTYQIKRGQNIWQICNDIYQIPIWLVAKYNPERDLSKLNPGDTLAIPVVLPINPAAVPPEQ